MNEGPEPFTRLYDILFCGAATDTRAQSDVFAHMQGFWELSYRAGGVR